MTDVGLSYLRAQTKAFIDLDPTDVILTPVVRQSTPGGGSRIVDGVNRLPQTFKLIWTGGTNHGIVETIDGQDSQYDMILIGEWNSQIDINDYFIHSGVKYQVIGFMPNNEYEKRAALKAYGVKPIGG